MNIEETPIRYVWNSEKRQWNYSIVDTIDFVIQSKDARNYWKVLKNRLKKKDNHIPYNCNQLKMKSRDGKLYLTDVTDAKHLLEIANIISDFPPIALEPWIMSIENKKPIKSIRTKKSYPQKKKDSIKESHLRSFRNRLKRFFNF